MKDNRDGTTEFYATEDWWTPTCEEQAIAAVKPKPFIVSQELIEQEVAKLRARHGELFSRRWKAGA